MVTSSEFDGIVAIELGAGTGNGIFMPLKGYEKLTLLISFLHWTLSRGRELLAWSLSVCVNSPSNTNFPLKCPSIKQFITIYFRFGWHTTCTCCQNCLFDRYEVSVVHISVAFVACYALSCDSVHGKALFLGF